MKKLFGTLTALSLMLVVSFCFVGCGGTKAVYDMEGNKFGKATEVATTEAPTSANVTYFSVGEDAITALDATLATTVKASVSASGIKANTNVDTNTSYMFDSASNAYYVMTKSNVSGKVLGQKFSETGYEYDVANDGNVYQGTVNDFDLDTILAGTPTASYTTASFSTDFAELIASMGESIDTITEYVTDGIISKLTVQETETAIKYNYSFDSTGIQTIVEDSLSEIGSTEGMEEFASQLNALVISDMKVSYYMVFTKDAEGNPDKMIESNADISFKGSLNTEGITVTMNVSTNMNFRVNKINEDVVLPF